MYDCMLDIHKILFDLHPHFLVGLYSIPLQDDRISHMVLRLWLSLFGLIAWLPAALRRSIVHNLNDCIKI